jgi:hypothetical protein
VATTFSSTSSKVQVSNSLSSLRTGLTSIDDAISLSYPGPALANGVAAGQADRRYVAQLSIAASGTVTLNLSSLLDAFGGSIAFLRLKEIYVALTTLSAAAAILVGGGTNAITSFLSAGTLQVRNGTVEYLGCCPDSTGYVVTPSTGDQLKFVNSDASLIAYTNVCLVGCSA